MIIRFANFLKMRSEPSDDKDTQKNGEKKGTKKEEPTKIIWNINAVTGHAIMKNWRNMQSLEPNWDGKMSSDTCVNFQ